ncbi:MAG: DedA family protein [bacterium]
MIFNINTQTVLALIKEYKYLAIFLGSFIEGINIMLIGGFFVALGILNIWLVLLLLFLGDILSDTMWYFVGYFGGSNIIQKFVKFLRAEKKMQKLKRYLNERGGRVIIPIKFTSGFCFIMLLTAGSIRMNFKKFIKFDLIGSAGWVAFMFSLGYFFGESFERISQNVSQVGFVIALIIISALILVKIIQKLAGKAENLE